MTRLLPLLMALVSLNCDEPRKAAPVPATPPPDAIQFPTAASGVRYSYFDDVGRPVVVRGRGEVPDYLLDFSAVLIADRTNAPAGQVYRLRPAESDERVSVARLAYEEPLKHASSAAWAAAIAGIGAWEFAMVSAELAAMESQPSARDGDGRGRGKPASGGNSKKAASTIEIVSIASDIDEPPARGQSQNRVLAPSGWKSVTFYYKPSCPYCQRAMRFMDENNVHYTRRNVDNDLRARTEMTSAQRYAGRRTGGVPTFVIGTERQVMQGWDRDRFIELARR